MQRDYLVRVNTWALGNPTLRAFKFRVSARFTKLMIQYFRAGTYGSLHVSPESKRQQQQQQREQQELGHQGQLSRHGSSSLELKVERRAESEVVQFSPNIICVGEIH